MAMTSYTAKQTAFAKEQNLSVEAQTALSELVNLAYQAGYTEGLDHSFSRPAGKGGKKGSPNSPKRSPSNHSFMMKVIAGVKRGEERFTQLMDRLGKVTLPREGEEPDAGKTPPKDKRGEQPEVVKGVSHYRELVLGELELEAGTEVSLRWLCEQLVNIRSDPQELMQVNCCIKQTFSDETNEKIKELREEFNNSAQATEGVTPVKKVSSGKPAPVSYSNFLKLLREEKGLEIPKSPPQKEHFAQLSEETQKRFYEAKDIKKSDRMEELAKWLNEGELLREISGAIERAGGSPILSEPSANAGAGEEEVEMEDDQPQSPKRRKRDKRKGSNKKSRDERMGVFLAEYAVRRGIKWKDYLQDDEGNDLTEQSAAAEAKKILEDEDEKDWKGVLDEWIEDAEAEEAEEED